MSLSHAGNAKPMGMKSKKKEITLLAADLLLHAWISMS